MFNDLNKDGVVLANGLFWRHPTVNQSFIDKIVAEIEADDPLVKPVWKTNKLKKIDDLLKANSQKSRNPLQQLIDNVADSVVKEVTTEFKPHIRKPTRRVTVPKPAKKTQKTDVMMPLLNDIENRRLGSQAPAVLESSANKPHSKDADDLPPEMISSDDIIENLSPESTPEDITPPSTDTNQDSLLQSESRLLAGNQVSRGSNPERPGLEEMRELLKSKSRLKARIHLKTLKPTTEKGKKKLTIPATTEGKPYLCNEHVKYMLTEVHGEDLIVCREVTDQMVLLWELVKFHCPIIAFRIMFH